MDTQFFNPGTLSAPRGFTHGVLARPGRLLFLAGQVGSDASGTITAPGDLPAQFAQALTNLNTVLTEAGGQPTDVVKLTLYVTDIAAYRAQREALGQAYRAVFGRHYPAMTLVEVRALVDPQAMIEVDGFAVLAEPA
jgi:enamine deaminase RidA (YjgF/YER057c/UK114 family)